MNHLFLPQLPQPPQLPLLAKSDGIFFSLPSSPCSLRAMGYFLNWKSLMHRLFMGGFKASTDDYDFKGSMTMKILPLPNSDFT